MRERPGLEALYQKYKDKGFTVVAISIDRQGAAIVRPYVRQHKLTFPHLLDPDSRVARGQFSLQGTPGNYLIAREGNVVGGAIGYRDWTSPVAQKLIERLTEENSSS